MTTPAEVVARRRSGRRERLDRARAFAAQLPETLGVVAVVVFGSVARGDWNSWSDIDVLVVAEHLPASYRQRLDLLGAWPPGVEPVVWTPAEWRRHRQRDNPIAVEALQEGVWLVGDPGAVAR